jgi:antibiotic biosynthesis monooxygenase (ABM) superfamily enzyme
LLAQYADQDAAMVEQDPTAWTQARGLDDWLVEHREDKTPIGEYKLRCLTLHNLYKTWTPEQQRKAI